MRCLRWPSFQRLLRLPDFHTVSKAGTVGSCPELLRRAVHIGELSTALPARAGVVFFMLMAPISADLLAKAAYSAGYRLWQGSLSDDLAETVARDKKNRIVAT
ncbi:cation:proton antiporter [Aminobacter niigataensis]|uniref:cation:proton antiporter n=1 Tax=Aminobacter niigataensis TaxID=83265 RepID=UPI0031E0FC81